MKRIFLLFLFVVFYLTGLTQGLTRESVIELRIDKIIKELSLREKVAMCHAQSKFSIPGVARLGIPELWMSDGPHGVRGEIKWDEWGYAGWTNDSITAFPALTCLASTFNPALSYEYGHALGEEARYRNKDVLLGPGVNIYRTPLNGRNFEYMGEDPYLASQLVVPYIQGVQSNKVSACVKHYALNNQEKWRGHINVEVDDRALHEIYLPAFKAAVEEGGVWTLMGAYNKYKGQHATTNSVLMNDILKDDWGFDGVVVSDWGSTHDTQEAALNGLDIEMGTGTNGLTSSKQSVYDSYYLADPFYEAIESGAIDESVVNDKVRRILRLMYRTTMSENRPFGKMNNKAHHDVARKVATEGIVLLKNEGHFFPLDPSSNRTIAVIGENATKAMTVGGGSSELKAKYEISPLDGLRLRYGKSRVLYSMGYSSGPSSYHGEIPPSEDQDSLRQAAISIAKRADVVLFVGGLNKNHHQDTEGADRISYHLPYHQDELLEDIMEVNTNVGVVLVSGNAVAMPWVAKVKGIIQAWYLGSDAGYAIADIISGDVNPSGKLPISFPIKLEDNAAHHFGELSYPGDSITQYYKEGILVGYRWFDTKDIKPLFPFGYGLSYSTFEYSDIQINKEEYSLGEDITVSFSLKNTSNIAGAEVAQLYVSDPECSVMRPLKELKGFKKVYLEGNETKQVSMTIPIESLAFYSEEDSDWVVEPGKFILQVNSSSAENHLKETIRVK